jgi:hypothetical protein
MNAIEAEHAYPTQIAVQDFEFASSAVTENTSVFHQATNLARSSSADERRLAIGRDAATTLSDEIAKRLRKDGFNVARVHGDDEVPIQSNFLLVTGRLIDVDEGNRFERVAVGFGSGESRLATEVHVFRMVNGEKAGVLNFITDANSGKMPGIAASMGLGELVLGPVTAIAAVENAASSGQKIYSSQMEYLAGESGDHVARYLSQYFATEGWISKNKAKSVHLASSIAAVEGRG